MAGPINRPKPAAIIKCKHRISSKNPSVGFILDAFQKLSMEAKNLVDLKYGQ